MLAFFTPPIKSQRLERWENPAQGAGEEPPSVSSANAKSSFASCCRAEDIYYDAGLIDWLVVRHSRDLQGLGYQKKEVELLLLSIQV